MLGAEQVPTDIAPNAWLSPDPYRFYVTDRKVAEQYGYTRAVYDQPRSPASDAEGWTPEHDDEHSDGDLREAAIGYAQGVTRCGTRADCTSASRGRSNGGS